MKKDIKPSDVVLHSREFESLDLFTQVFYAQIFAEADEVGLIRDIKTLQKLTNWSADRYSKLEDSGFIFALPNGVIAITHWPTHDHAGPNEARYTMLGDSMSMLIVRDGKYMLRGTGMEGD